MKQKLHRLLEAMKRHAGALWYALSTVVPLILRRGRRPVMFAKYSGMGDIICTFPAVLELKKKHPGAAFLYNCHAAFVSLPPMAGVTTQVTSLRHAGVLRYWYGWLFEAFYEFPCADELPDDFCKEYVVKEYASDHGVSVPEEHPRLTIPADAQERVRQLLKNKVPAGARIVTFQTGPTWPIREWPQESWRDLIAELQRRPDVVVVQLGTSGHLAMGAAEVPIFPGVVSMVDQLSLEESSALIAASALFIGIDSGLIHLAAALRVPCSGVFGPTSPALRLPPSDVAHCVVSEVECQGCHHRVPRIHWEKGCPYDARCMKTISAAHVWSAIQPILSAAGNPTTAS